MEESKQIEIRGGIAVPFSEIRFRFSRSGGPGGQHVDRTETQVELLFDVESSASLSDSQKRTVLDKLKGYIDKEGVLHLVSDSTRSQSQNRKEVIERFRKLVAWALRPGKRRRPTRPSRSARERRLAAKKRRSEKKRRRKKPELEE